LTNFDKPAPIKIDDQFVSVGCLNREIGRLVSLENAI
jgi:hypothetical protein